MYIINTGCNIVSDSYFNNLVENVRTIKMNEKDELAAVRSKIFVDLCLTPKKIILHDPATIILWDDDTKTVVKCNPEYDTFDPEKGIALCFMKKALGNRGKFNDILKKGIEDNEQENLPSTALFGKSLSKFVDLITAKEEEKLDDEY